MKKIRRKDPSLGKLPNYNKQYNSSQVLINNNDRLLKLVAAKAELKS